MRRALGGLLAGLLLGFASPGAASGADASELRRELRALRAMVADQAKQLERQAGQLAEQRDRIEALRDSLDQRQATRRPGGEVGYRKGLFLRTRDEPHSLHFQFLFQPRYEFSAIENEEDVGTFLVQRAQLRLYGHALDPRLTYKMMLMANTRASGGGEVELRDLWLDWRQRSDFRIRLGQDFVHYDHENLQPAWALSFVDRSIVSAGLGFERDIGVRLHGRLAEERLSYHVYVMNGEGRNRSNPDGGLLLGSRVDYQLLGSRQFPMPDLAESPTPQLSWGAAWLRDDGADTLSRFTTDLAFRYAGFSALGAVNLAHNEDRGETDAGMLVQAGMFVVPRRFELALRWARVLHRGALGAATFDPREATIGVNYYLEGHAAKLQADFSRLWDPTETRDRTDRIRLQAQLFF